MAWLGGDRYWTVAEASMAGRFGPAATEEATDPRWKFYEAGTHEITVPVEGGHLQSVLVRMLNSHKDGIVPPSKIFLFTSGDGEKTTMHS